MSGGDPANGVGDAGSGGDHGKPRSAGELRGRFGGEDGGLLVSYVDEAHDRSACLDSGLATDSGIVEREDVRPREREHRLDTVGDRSRDCVCAAMTVQGCRLLRHVPRTYPPTTPTTPRTIPMR